MRVLVTGDRDWANKRIEVAVLEGLWATNKPGDEFVVIEGGATGADAVASAYIEHEIESTGNELLGHKTYKAKWDKFGKRAGPIRNEHMLKDSKPDIVVAFHDDILTSKGTKHMINISIKQGVPTYLVSKVTETYGHE